MKRALILLMLLSGCGSKEEEIAPDDGAAVPPLPNMVAPAAEDPAQLQARVAGALQAVLQDAKSARYANVRSGTAGAACGEVDAKGPGGRRTGFRPFVVTPDGMAMVSTAPKVTFNNPADPFPDYYIRWCATTEELANLGTATFNAARDATNMIGVPELPVEPVPGAPALPQEPAPAAPAPTAEPPAADTTPRPKTGGGSFFDAVIRKPEPAPAKKD
jgi:hypothetical protein